MNRTFLIVLGCLLLFACKEGKEKESDVTVIQVPDIGDGWMDMSEIIDTVIYIPLRSADSCLLDANMLRRLEYYNGKFYCFIFTQGFYIFHGDGSLCNIIPFGRGPGELYMANSHKAFWIDKGQNKLVFPGWHKMHFYDLDGHHISTEDLKMKLIPAQAAIENGNYWFFFFGRSSLNKNGDAFHFYQYDKEKGLVKGYVPASPINNYAEGGFGTGSCILANSPLSNDTIYKITNGNFLPFYYVDFGKNKLPDNISGEGRYNTKKRRGYTGELNNIVTNDTVLYFTYTTGRVIAEAYYFNTSGKIFTGSRHKKNRNLYVPFGKTMSYTNGYFVAFADSYHFVRDAPDIAKNLGVTEDDNPVIVLYKLKLN